MMKQKEPIWNILTGGLSMSNDNKVILPEVIASLVVRFIVDDSEGTVDLLQKDYAHQLMWECHI